ncbi:arsinothricin resistance N-acetyltransferase ArsN1 [soil metagenome]
MPTDLNVRPALATDLKAVANIYNQGIRGRSATFETKERTPEDIVPWLERPHPFLVAEHFGEILGWVSGSEYRPRDCYRGVAEFSVYVAEEARNQRVADALMSVFLPACAAGGFWKILSRVFPENTASRALCKRHGFREVGVYERHAQLGGVWKDVVIVERLLSETL